MAASASDSGANSAWDTVAARALPAPVSPGSGKPGQACQEIRTANGDFDRWLSVCGESKLHPLNFALQQAAMTDAHHSMSALFAQLGLGNTPDQIRGFIAQHRPLSDEVLLADASFWSVAQASFIREQRLLDADWSQPIDALSVALRDQPVLQPDGQGNSDT